MQSLDYEVAKEDKDGPPVEPGAKDFRRYKSALVYCDSGDGVVVLMLYLVTLGYLEQSIG